MRAVIRDVDKRAEAMPRPYEETGGAMTNGRETAVADLVIRGGTVVAPEAELAASVAIKDGKVLAVGAHEAMPPARDFSMRPVCTFSPAPSMCTCISATRAIRTRRTSRAARQRPHSVASPPSLTCPTPSRPRERRGARGQAWLAAEKAYVDFGLYGLLGEDTIAHVPELIAGGVIGFKLYMGNTFGRIASPSTGAMLEAFETVAPTGKRISLHAETNSIMERRETRLREEGRTDALAHLASRPAVVALEAVSRAAILAEWTGARIHILHISSADELRPLREAKARGVDITGETGPHYLMLCADDYARLGGVIRVNPPVREARHQEPLWAALADGTIDLIATDHAPHAQEEKTRNDIWSVDAGFPGVETQMPLMLTAVQAGRMSLCEYVRLSAAAPAKVWGLYPRKGVILPGADADIAIVDLAREWSIEDSFESRSNMTPWIGGG